MHVSLPFVPSADGLVGWHIRPVRDVGEWNTYFRALPQPHLMQAWAYGEAKRVAARMHVERIVFERGRLPVAICQVLQARIGGVAVGTRINRGPVFLDAHPAFSVREGVMRLVRRRWRIGRGGPLLIAPALADTDENRDLMRALGFCVRRPFSWMSAVIDLTLPEEDIHMRLDSSWRNHLKKAQKNGLVARASNSPETLAWMLERHRENMSAKGFRGPRPELLEALYRANPEDFTILQALHQDKPVAAMIVVRYGRNAEHYVGWFGAEGRKLGSGNFLYWEALRMARKAGAQWFDLGGYENDERYGHFKQNMRGREYRLAGEWVGF